MVRTQVQLTEKQAEALRRLALARGCSVAQLVRQGVELALSGSATVLPAERRRRALAAVGRFRSGRRDVSAKHDDHLGEAFGS
jgi:hypothetical protein